jgi:hypothetical protein
MNKEYNYKELLTREVLAVLYRYKLNKKTGYYSLTGIIASLGEGEKTTAQEINEIAKYLEALGYVKAEFTFGDVFVSITPAGIVQIEETLHAVSGPGTVESFAIFPNEQQKPQLDEFNEDSIAKAKQPILAMLDEMQGRVKAKFGDSAKDVIDDLNIFKMELGKDNPDVEVLALKLASVERMSLLKSYIPQLRELLNL